MSHYGKHPSLHRDTEPVDTAVWHWFVCNGPHGERFSWHKDAPVSKRDIELLAEFIEVREKAGSGFKNNARLTALEAITHTDPVMVLKAIHVLTVIGTDEDLVRVQKLLAHPDQIVCKHARSALFERGVKQPNKPFEPTR